MIWQINTLFALLILCSSTYASSGRNADDSLDRRDGLIQEAVKSLLGVKDTLETRAAAKKRPPDPPRYMLDLYDSYKSGQMPTQGNTVRSILSMRGKIEGVDMLVFNLTGVQPDEQILQGRLHLFKRRRSRGFKRRETSHYRLKVMDLRSPNEPQFIDITLRQKQGWQSYDVTDSVRKCRSSKRNGDYLMGVSAENQRPSGKYRSTSLKRVLRISSQPFLIIFSEDRNNRSDMQVQSNRDTLSVIEDLLRQVRNGSHGNLSLTADDVLTERTKRSVAEEDLYIKPADSSVFSRNKFRVSPATPDVLKVPTVPMKVKTTFPDLSSWLSTVLEGNVTSTHEVGLLANGRQNEGHGLSFAESVAEDISGRRWRRSLSSNDVPYDTMDSNKLTEKEKVLEKYSRKIDPNIIPLPRSMEEQKVFSWRKSRRRRRRRKNRKLPFWWIKYEGKHSRHNAERVCQRKRLVVDFASIGWSEWVISPNAFDSYYCAGRCSFPLIKNGKPSNHATIQSLVHAMNRDLHVPAPCCVPSTTSSLTLLYFDENRNVVLKNYPNMIVESCACR